MPIYEYRCGNCGKKNEILVLSPESEISCPNCGENGLTRLMSAFSYHRSEVDRMSAIDTSHPWGDYCQDERNVGLRAKKRLKEMGCDPGPEFDGIVEEQRKKVAEELSE